MDYPRHLICSGRSAWHTAETSEGGWPKSLQFASFAAIVLISLAGRGGMGGLRIAMYALLVLGGLAVALTLVNADRAAAAGERLRNDQLVYCLGSAHRAQLAQAAVTLGRVQAAVLGDKVRVADRDLSLEMWRKLRSDDFNRVCAALAAAALPVAAAANGAIQTTFIVILPAIIGALLTLAIEDLKTTADRRWAQADALRAAWRAFTREVADYTDKRSAGDRRGVARTSSLDERRSDLVTVLRAINAQHRRSQKIRHLQASLQGDLLGPRITMGWPPIGQDAEEARNARARAIAACIRTSSAHLDAVVAALESVVWPFWRKI